MVLPRRPAALSLLRSVCQLCSRSGAHLLARERLFPWRCPQQWPDSGNGRVSTGKFYLCGNKLLTVEKAYQSNYPWVEISRPRWGNADKSTRTAQSWGECLFLGLILRTEPSSRGVCGWRILHQKTCRPPSPVLWKTQLEKSRNAQPLHALVVSYAAKTPKHSAK